MSLADHLLKRRSLRHASAVILHEHHLPIDVERFTMEFFTVKEKNFHASFLRTYSLTLSHLNE